MGIISSALKYAPTYLSKIPGMKPLANLISKPAQNPLELITKPFYQQAGLPEIKAKQAQTQKQQLNAGNLGTMTTTPMGMVNQNPTMPGASAYGITPDMLRMEQQGSIVKSPNQVAIGDGSFDTTGLSNQQVKDFQNVIAQSAAKTNVPQITTNVGNNLGQAGVTAPKLSLPEKINLDFKGTIPTSQLEGSTTQTDIQRLLAQNEDMQRQMMEAMQPTAMESDLQNQIADIRNIANRSILSTQAGIDLEGQRVIPKQFITGRQQAISEAGQRELNTLAAQEENLVNRLNIAQSDRATKVEGFKTALGFMDQNISTRMQINDAIQKEQAMILDQANRLSQEAKTTLGQVLDMFAGRDFEELDTNAQQQLAMLSQQAGIPFDLIRAGMKSAKDEMSYEEMLKLQGLEYDVENKRLAMVKTQQDLLNYETSVGALTPEQITKLDKAPEVENMAILENLGNVAKQYKNLVDTYGYEAVGTDKALLEETYATLQVAWKEAAKLGVLAGPDLDLLAQAVKPMTGVSGINTMVFSGGKQGSLAGLQQMLDRIQRDGNQNYQRLLLRDPAYQKSDYVTSLGLPFMDFTKQFSEEELQEAIDAGYSKEEINEVLRQQMTNGLFSQDLSKSKNYLPQVTQNLSGLSNGQTTLSRLGAGNITRIDGSEYWKPGLDFYLQGGKGAKVKAPFGGEVIYTGKNGGFGNQVKIKLDDGNELWMSHLDNIYVKQGQRINAGEIFGTQGNSGTVINADGSAVSPQQLANGFGTHLDITIKTPKGYVPARQVAAMMGDIRLS